MPYVKMKLDPRSTATHGHPMGAIVGSGYVGSVLIALAVALGTHFTAPRCPVSGRAQQVCRGK